jgi:molybdopterin synthase catalytic subunit
MNNSILVNGPITGEMISSSLQIPEGDINTGAHSIFIGMVRSDVRGVLKVRAIEYSAYEPMVNREAAMINESVLVAFDDVVNIEIFHSTGLVPAGGISLLVVVSGGHRQQVQAACSRVVELIKERLPVWKKEIYEDNSQRWIQDHLA